MSRIPLAVIAAICSITAMPAAASPSPTPAPHQAASPKPRKTPVFSSKVTVPPANGNVSAADCRRHNTTVATGGGTMGPNGASKSQTLVTVPVGGSGAAAASRAEQINEACNKQQH